MSNVQIYLTIGVPTIAILIGILLNLVQINSINAPFAAMETRFNNLEARIDARFKHVDARFNSLEVKFDTLIGKVIELDHRVTRIAAKLDLR